MNKQFVLVEFDNSAPWVQLFTSDKPITIEEVAEYYTDKEGFNPERDSITFIDDPNNNPISLCLIDSNRE
jgi:hypothetical protein